MNNQDTEAAHAPRVPQSQVYSLRTRALSSQHRVIFHPQGVTCSRCRNGATLGDAPPRNPKDRDYVRDLPVPAGPIKRVVTAMFEKPMELEEECQELYRFLSALEGQEPDKEPSGKGQRRHCKNGAFGPRVCGLTEVLSFARFPQISVNLVFAVPNQEGSALAA